MTKGQGRSGLLKFWLVLAQCCLVRATPTATQQDRETVERRSLCFVGLSPRTGPNWVRQRLAGRGPAPLAVRLATLKLFDHCVQHRLGNRRDHRIGDSTSIWVFTKSKCQVIHEPTDGF